MTLRQQMKNLGLGLSRKEVSLIPHKSSWIQAFHFFDQIIRQEIPFGLKIHHIGSTAIPEISAKPVLDVLGEVASIEDFDSQRSIVESLGFVWRGEYGIAGRRYCVLYDEKEEEGLIHFHVFAKTNKEFEKHLIFRDYLNASPSAAKRYEDLKNKLVITLAHQRAKYSEGKSALIDLLLSEAQAWRQKNQSLSPALKLKSLSYRTDLSILAFQGRLEEHEEYVVAESLGNPDYYWGNLLVMKRPPAKGDFEKWTQFFTNEFRHQPKIKHMTFGWDTVEGIEGEIRPFIEDGFEMEKSFVLILEKSKLVQPKNASRELQVRPLVTDDDWEAAIQNQVACRLLSLERESYLGFKRTQMKKFRDMADAGLGHWFGAFVEEKLVGDCGLFVFGDVARYQSVGTHPDFRKTGVCSNLVYASAQYAFENLGAHTLVMVADPEYHAAKIYESVGFEPKEMAIGICRHPKSP